LARRKGSVPGSRQERGSLPPPSPRPPGSRADYVHSVLRQEILDGTLQPGTPILQDEIGARLGVSITPVREALRRLESAGLVSYQTHYGATVTELSREAVAELYHLRAAVEGRVARLAAQRITPEQLDRLRAIHAEMTGAREPHDTVVLAEGSRRFHATIAEIGGPAIFARHLRGIWESFPVPKDQSILRSDGVVDWALEAHKTLIDALARGDGDEAERLMSEHIQRAGAERICHVPTEEFA
jgi:DNA-binding GntR family transcriptional regulator